MRHPLAGLLLLVPLGAGLAEETAPVGSASFAIQGMTLQLRADDPGGDEGAALAELRRLGATHVLLTVDVHQRDGRGLPERRPEAVPDPALLRAIRAAQAERLAVILQPRLVLADAGELSPPDWAAWFRAWERVLLHYGRLASEADVDVLSLGAGLSGAEAHTARCRELVARVRRVYGGALTWTADPDRYQAVGFWGDLDYVALAGGWPLARAGDPEPGVEDLAAAWDGIKADLLAWRRKARLTAPLLLLEPGDPSPAGCEAFARAWKGTRELAGVVFHEGGPRHGGDAPAREVLRALFGGPGPAPPAPLPEPPALTAPDRAPPRRERRGRARPRA